MDHILKDLNAHRAALPSLFQGLCMLDVGKRLSTGQIRQDLFVLAALGDKPCGYFVDIGAGNGVTMSNTYMLEKVRQWKGLLVEPARGWHESLLKNRVSTVDNRCVWNKSGERLEFTETADAHLSTISKFLDLDKHAKVRRNTIVGQYEVVSVSFNDLLEEHRAPKVVDYLSMDTEGSEYDILSALDFSRYSFRVITIEHNFTPNRAKLQQLLQSRGYVIVLPQVSEFDDWYIGPAITTSG
jgi:FkbM family methyltransferase